MNIDPNVPIKDLLQKYFDDGFNKGVEVGKRKILEEIQPKVTSHSNLSGSTLPPFVDIRLNKKAEVAFNFDPSTFVHHIAVQSFQRDQYNKAFALYSTAPVSRGDAPNILKYFLENAIEKDYYDNYGHRDKKTFMEGVL